jgi:CelD/BcsL family acetyltransferase involved in cellulose biosynthesis
VANVTVITEPHEFERIGPVWDDLVRRAQPAHPFLTHAWFRTWWDAFGGDRRLYVVVVHDGRGPIAIAPLMRARTKVLGVEVDAVEPIVNDHTPRYEFILTDRRRAACRTIWEHLRDAGHGWQLLFARQLPSGSITLSTLAACAEQDGYLVGRRTWESSPFVSFSGTWARFYAARSRNHRSKVNTGLNRLRRLGAVQLETVTEGPMIETALQDGFRIEAAAWKARTGTAIVCDETVGRFYRDLATRAASAGTLRLLFLNVAGRRIAFAYALEAYNRLFVLKAGYDPEFARYSPYNVLCALVFQDAFARRLDEYEFLGGNEAWKRSWTDHVHTHEWLYVFRPTLGMRALYELKCRLLPRLHRSPAFERLRGALFTSR